MSFVFEFLFARRRHGALDKVFGGWVVVGNYLLLVKACVPASTRYFLFMEYRNYIILIY